MLRARSKMSCAFCEEKLRFASSSCSTADLSVNTGAADDRDVCVGGGGDAVALGVEAVSATLDSGAFPDEVDDALEGRFGGGFVETVGL